MPIYLQPEQFDDPPAPFRSGAAGHVWLGPDGDFERDTRIHISANTTHALIGHGVLDELNALPLMGTLGGGLDVVIPQDELKRASAILFEADRTTYGPGSDWDFAVGVDSEDRPCRVRIDNREFQRGLLRISDVFEAASRIGAAAWVRI